MVEGGKKRPYHKELSMSHDITESENRLPDRDRDLARLAECANQAHEKVEGAVQQAVVHALEAGQALLAAKAICLKGAWTAWLKANFCASARTARGYMRLVVHWNHVGGDRQRAADLSQRQIDKLLKGLARSDGRANPPRAPSQKRLSPAAAPQDEPSQPQPLPSASNDLAAVNPQLPNGTSGDPFELVGRLLEQVVAELRRLRETRPDDARYARHLLQPLERIRGGIATRR
jgi:hypothetical protein